MIMLYVSTIALHRRSYAQGSCAADSAQPRKFRWLEVKSGQLRARLCRLCKRGVGAPGSARGRLSARASTGRCARIPGGSKSIGSMVARRAAAALRALSRQSSAAQRRPAMRAGAPGGQRWASDGQDIASDESSKRKSFKERARAYYVERCWPRLAASRAPAALASARARRGAPEPHAGTAGGSASATSSRTRGSRSSQTTASPTRRERSRSPASSGGCPGASTAESGGRCAPPSPTTPPCRAQMRARTLTRRRVQAWLEYRASWNYFWGDPEEAKDIEEEDGGPARSMEEDLKELRELMKVKELNEEEVMTVCAGRRARNCAREGGRQGEREKGWDEEGENESRARRAQAAARPRPDAPAPAPAQAREALEELRVSVRPLEPSQPRPLSHHSSSVGAMPTAPLEPSQPCSARRQRGVRGRRR